MSSYEILDSNSWELKTMMINRFQELSGRILTEASPETKIFETVAYMMGLREEKYNDDMKQNYLKYARGNRLDLKGEMYGSRGERLRGVGASAVFRFAISEIQQTDIIIPKGSRIQYNDLFFITNDEYIISKGSQHVEGLATCTVIGSANNGIPAGQIKHMVDIFPYYQSVENITPTNDGSDIEEDENYRDRIRQIPESFTNAGSYGAYRFWAKTSSPEIIDVSVTSPSAGSVDIYVLTKNKTLSEGLKSTIESVVNDDSIRPLTDKVTIKNVNKVNYNIDLDYYIDKTNETLVNDIKEKVNTAVKNYIKWQEEKIGRDINPDELIKLMKLAGVKRVVLRSPAFQKLEITDVAVVDSNTLNYLGVEIE